MVRVCRANSDRMNETEVEVPFRYEETEPVVRRVLAADSAVHAT